MSVYVVFGFKTFASYPVSGFRSFEQKVFDNEADALAYLREINGNDCLITPAENIEILGYPAQTVRAIPRTGIAVTGWVNPRPDMIIVADELRDKIVILLGIEGLTGALRHKQSELEDLESERKSLSEEIRETRKAIADLQRQLDATHQQLDELDE